MTPSRPANNWNSPPSREAGWESSALAAILVAALGFSLVLWTISCRGLYADGSNYLLHILQSHDFFHVSQTRITSTLATQWPVVAAIALGLRSMHTIVALYTFSLAVIPIGCYIAAIFISRNNALLLSATSLVIALSFYPLSFYLVSEANVYLALFWLAFVLLLAETTVSVTRAVILLLISAGALAAYETAAFFSALLAALTFWRATGEKNQIVRLALFVAASLFICGSCIGLVGVFFPRDPKNEGSFLGGLRTFLQNRSYRLNVALTLFVAASSFVPKPGPRLTVQTVLFAALVLFVYWGLHSPVQLGLGYVIFQRAQIFVTAAIVTIGVLAVLFIWVALFKRNRIHLLVLAMPLLAVVIIDTADTFGWNRYLGRECAELRAGAVNPDFFREDDSRKYGIGWTFPTVSILLRNASSRAMMVDPQFRGWLPFDPKAEVPDVREFERDGGFCGPMSAGKA